MTPSNISYGQLLHWDTELERMSGSITGLFFKGKITEFYKQNGARINTLKSKINELQTKYFVIENNQIKHAGEEGKQEPVLLEGKTMMDYRAAYTRLMQEVVSINV